MLRFVLIAIGFHAFQLSGTLAVSVFFEDIQFTYASEEYFSNLESYITDDQEMFLNATIIKRFPENLQSRLVMFGLSQGEYVIPSGMDIELEMCDMIAESFIMGDLLVALGFSSDDCPPSPGVYGTEGYYLDTTNFPDSFPRNKYLAIFTLDEDDKNILVTHIYVVSQ